MQRCRPYHGTPSRVQVRYSSGTAAPVCTQAYRRAVCAATPIFPNPFVLQGCSLYALWMFCTQPRLGSTFPCPKPPHGSRWFPAASSASTAGETGSATTKSWQIDQWRFADMSPAVDVRKGGGGGGGARKEAAEERRRSLSPSERSSQRGEEQDDEYVGSDLSPITRRSRTLLHNMKGERRCITDLANHGLLTLL